MTIKAGKFGHEYIIETDVKTKNGYTKQASIKCWGFGDWSIIYRLPNTNYKHGFKSYYACIEHLKKLGW